MGAGQYRTLARVERPTDATNAAGQRVQTWPGEADEPWATIWVRPDTIGSGGQQSDHGRQQATQHPHRYATRSTVTTRAIKATDRLRLVTGPSAGLVVYLAAVGDLDQRGREVVLVGTDQRPAGT